MQSFVWFVKSKFIVIDSVNVFLHLQSRLKINIQEFVLMYNVMLAFSTPVLVLHLYLWHYEMFNKLSKYLVIRNTDVPWRQSVRLYMHSLCSANHPSNCVSTVLVADRSKTNKPVKHLMCIETEPFWSSYILFRVASGH